MLFFTVQAFHLTVVWGVLGARARVLLLLLLLLLMPLLRTAMVCCCRCWRLCFAGLVPAGAVLRRCVRFGVARLYGALAHVDDGAMAHDGALRM